MYCKPGIEITHIQTLTYKFTDEELKIIGSLRGNSGANEFEIRELKVWSGIVYGSTSYGNDRCFAMNKEEKIYARTAFRICKLTDIWAD